MKRRKENKSANKVKTPNQVRKLIWNQSFLSIIRAHAGEVSFPGGRCETGERVVETAIRETTEELGIHSDKIDVWDTLRPVMDKKGTLN